MRRIISAAAMAVLLPLASMAQESSVTGKLTLLKKYPVQNMKVTSSKTGDVSTSNTDGVFSIKTCDKDVLVIKCDPFKTVNYKVRIGKQDTINIDMAFPRKAIYLTQIMDEGYLASHYEDAYSALLFQKDYSKYNDIDQAISMELPSIRIVSPNCYQLPGITAMSSNGYMLMVVGNRIVSSIQDIPTSNIEDIQVLKGAQATIYGLQGGNGVLVIKIKNTDDELYKKD